MSVLDELHGWQRRLAARIKELEPLVQEHAELVAIAERLGVDLENAEQPPVSKPEPPARKRAAEKRKPAPKRRAKGAAVRRQAGGTQQAGRERRQRVIELIGNTPGITVPDLSRELDVDAPSLYRVIRKLQSDGVVDKSGRGLSLTGGETPAAT